MTYYLSEIGLITFVNALKVVKSSLPLDEVSSPKPKFFLKKKK
jgi:hypothetical protein